MKNKISPSMMCVEINRLTETLQLFEQLKIEYLHIDVMDGVYVPNYAIGTDYIKQLRHLTSIPLDFHLMVQDPSHCLAWFDFQPKEIVSVHVEACTHLQRTLQQLKQLGVLPFVALNPATPLQVLDYILDDIAGVLIMTVNPGFAGQKAVPEALNKIQDTRNYLDQKGYEHIQIEVDGNVSYEFSKIMAKNGADIFVAGSSSFFTSIDDNMEQGIQRFRLIIN